MYAGGGERGGERKLYLTVQSRRASRGSSCVAQQVKDPALLQLWHRWQLKCWSIPILGISICHGGMEWGVRREHSLNNRFTRVL